MKAARLNVRAWIIGELEKARAAGDTPMSISLTQDDWKQLRREVSRSDGGYLQLVNPHDDATRTFMGVPLKLGAVLHSRVAIEVRSPR